MCYGMCTNKKWGPCMSVLYCCFGWLHFMFDVHNYKCKESTLTFSYPGREQGIYFSNHTLRWRISREGEEMNLSFRFFFLLFIFLIYFSFYLCLDGPGHPRFPKRVQGRPSPKFTCSSHLWAWGWIKTRANGWLIKWEDNTPF